mgnify:CR=1 FL=1
MESSLFDENLTQLTQLSAVKQKRKFRQLLKSFGPQVVQAIRQAVLNILHNDAVAKTLTAANKRFIKRFSRKLRQLVDKKTTPIRQFKIIAAAGFQFLRQILDIVKYYKDA